MTESDVNDFEIEEGLDQELENILNHPAPAYGEIDYWNQRYRTQKGEQFEWLQSWQAFLPLVEKKISQPRATALVIGCGNSRMSSDLLNSVGRVVSTDISESAISEMKERYSSEARLEWHTMDCARMGFANNSFDFVFDKGTIDTLMCSDNGAKLVDATVREAFRVLKPGGLFIVVSFGVPQTRKKYFEKLSGFTVEDALEVTKDGQKTNHYVYVVKKSD